MVQFAVAAVYDRRDGRQTALTERRYNAKPKVYHCLVWVDRGAGCRKK
jgi:hypothetical protein